MSEDYGQREIYGVMLDHVRERGVHSLATAICDALEDFNDEEEGIILGDGETAALDILAAFCDIAQECITEGVPITYEDRRAIGERVFRDYALARD